MNPASLNGPLQTDGNFANFNPPLNKIEVHLLIDASLI
jgi:hypothetical protein